MIHEKEYHLQKHTLASGGSIDEDALRHLKFRTESYRDLHRMLYVRLAADVLADTKTLEIPVLETWWDAFKKAYVPEWAMEQCDWLRPNYKRVRVELRRLWLDVEVPEHDTRVTVVTPAPECIAPLLPEQLQFYAQELPGKYAEPTPEALGRIAERIEFR